jgi:hypothetical protein
MSEESSELPSCTNSSRIVEEKELTKKENLLPTKDEYYLLLRAYETFRRLNRFYFQQDFRCIEFL